MAAPMLYTRFCSRFLKFNKITPNILANFCTSTNSGETNSTAGTERVPKVSNIVKAFSKLDKIAEDQKVDHDELENETFASLVRKSKLLQLGKIEGNIVSGSIIEVYEDDLYIDFGGKFHCVCQRPSVNPKSYHRGARVRVLLKDFEMSSSFLGSEKHVTLLEADGVLLGLDRSSGSKEKKD